MATRFLPLLVATAAAAVLATLTVPVGTAQAAAKKTTRVSGWSSQALTAAPGQAMTVRIAVRPAKTARPRTVLVQRRASDSRSWTTTSVARTGRGGALVVSLPTAQSFDGAIRLRVLGTRKARAVVTPARRLLVGATRAGGAAPPTTAFEAEVVSLVNDARRTGRSCGSQWYPAQGALRIDDRLSQASRDHASDMGRNAYFSHTSQDGRTPWDRARAAGYTTANGENIAAGYDTPSEVVAGWLASSGHCANIMSASARDIGVGFADVYGSPYGTYWVQMFGRG